MLEHTQLTDKELNDELLRDILTMPKWWLPAVLFLAAIVITGYSVFTSGVIRLFHSKL